MDYNKLADLLFPDAKPIEYWEEKYPRRNLAKECEVTRYAPSPTGFMHLGNFFQMFISYNIAKNSNGIFMKRLEDTDAKREKENAFEVIKEVMDKFGIFPDEYQEKGEEAVGNYGPYIQSLRKDIYSSYAKELVKKGRAFPCFCKAKEGKEEIFKDREEKFLVNDEYEYDICRDLSFEEIQKHLENGDKFAIRLRTNGTGKERVKFIDLIKGEIEAQANAKDVILIKQDGIPPYLFAHIVDDYLMGTTIIVRGEEYISSTPVHLEVIDALGLPHFKYCHNPLICKIPENGNKRKISKRYDPEADMRYYFEKGYPIEAVFEYLLNLISSSFEPWRINNPTLSWKEFKFGIDDITAVSPVLDMVKFTDIAKNIVATFTAEEVYERTLAWAKEYDVQFAEYLEKNKQYAIKVFEIDRYKEKPRKDIEMWSRIPEYYSFMFNPYFKCDDIKDFEIEKEKFEKAKEVVSLYKKIVNANDDKETWFNKIKEMANDLGYATNNKEYKQNPELYKGNVATVCEFIRVALTGKKDSLDLFSIISTIGQEETEKRLAHFENLLK